MPPVQPSTLTQGKHSLASRLLSDGKIIWFSLADCSFKPAVTSSLRYHLIRSGKLLMRSGLAPYYLSTILLSFHRICMAHYYYASLYPPPCFCLLDKSPPEMERHCSPFTTLFRPQWIAPPSNGLLVQLLEPVKEEFGLSEEFR